MPWLNFQSTVAPATTVTVTEQLEDVPKFKVILVAPAVPGVPDPKRVMLVVERVKFPEAVNVIPLAEAVML